MSFIQRLIAEPNRNNGDESIGITNATILQKYINDPNFPFLVSFPRTGSHWLRMIVELYFERPSLVRVFYYKDKNDYLMLHTHDMELNVYRKNVIYLYRNPGPTIYSQMVYENDDINNSDRVEYWGRYYIRHLRKWLLEENISQKKTIIRYENMMKDIGKEFTKITEHFGTIFDPVKLKIVVEQVSKQEVKKRTTHDQKVINVNPNYNFNREEFDKKYGVFIESLIKDCAPELSQFFKG